MLAVVVGAPSHRVLALVGLVVEGMALFLEQPPLVRLIVEVEVVVGGLVAVAAQVVSALVLV
jgi:hypothetical protein